MFVAPWFAVLCGFTSITLAFAGAYNYTSFHKIIQCEAPSGHVTPKSVEDVISIVKQATAANQSVRVVTANRWSITDVLCGLHFYLLYFVQIYLILVRLRPDQRSRNFIGQFQGFNL